MASCICGTRRNSEPSSGIGGPRQGEEETGAEARSEGGAGERAGLAHPLDLVLQVLQLRVLLVDEVELREVALLHWGRVGKSGSREESRDRETHRRTEKRDVEKDDAETRRDRDGEKGDTEKYRASQRERKTSRQRESHKETQKYGERNRKIEKRGKENSRDGRRENRGRREPDGHRRAERETPRWRVSLERPAGQEWGEGGRNRGAETPEAGRRTRPAKSDGNTKTETHTLGEVGGLQGGGRQTQQERTEGPGREFGERARRRRGWGQRRGQRGRGRPDGQGE